MNQLVLNAKHRAKANSEPFDLDREWAEDVLARQGYRCAVTGLLLTLDPPLAGRRVNYMSPSLDRVDNAAYYTKDNTRVVCWLYNLWKAELSDEEVLEFAKAVAAVQ